MKAIKIDTYPNCFFVILLSCMILLPLFVAGCKEKTQLRDINMVPLELWVDRHGELLSPDVKERLQVARETYKNEKLDPEPILIFAGLGSIVGFEDIFLHLLIFDEDKDILGFIITEKIKESSDSLSIIQERYPAFVHYPTITVAGNIHSLPISIRRDGQLKDDNLWEKYLSIDFDEQVKQIEDSNLSFAEYTDRVYRLWEASLPPIYVSMPEPNKLDVLVQIYDRAGNKSNQVELVGLTE